MLRVSILEAGPDTVVGWCVLQWLNPLVDIHVTSCDPLPLSSPPSNLGICVGLLLGLLH